MRTVSSAILAALIFIASAAQAGISLKPGPQLWVYSTRGSLESVRSLVTTNPFDKDVLGRALYHVLRRGMSEKPEEDVAMLKLLISYGADVNYRALNGQTPLMAAAMGKNMDAVRMLLENGADPQIADGRDKRAIDYAQASGGSLRMAELIRNPPPPDPIKKATPEMQPKVVNLDLTMENTDVFMKFDLIASGPVCVKVLGSLDKGANYNMKFTGASGDVGANIAPGNGKTIVWRSKIDYPRGFSEVDALIDVVAEPCK